MSSDTSTYRVQGMTCGHCRAAVLEEVGALPGVRQADVDLEAGTLTVQGDGVTEAAVREAVEEAGYEVVA